MKDNRDWMTDFNFSLYHRNRYGNFVPVSTWSIAFETAPGKLGKKEWEGYIEHTLEKAQQFGVRFKEQVLIAEIKPTENRVIATDKRYSTVLFC